MSARVAVLASGAGTNLGALMEDEVTGPWVVLTVSDVKDSGALERARAKAIEAVFVDPATHGNRERYDRALLSLLEARDIDYVALAGFMRILGPEFVKAFRGRMLNIHPSLLPAFPGAHSVGDALRAGVEKTGVTIHFVDEQVDHGPIVAQEEVPVLPGDDWESLEARVHSVEHRLYPMTLQALVEGRLKLGEAAS
ncbi:MAG: phosphoribosylglycinamide formyltransferase [Actinomycetota bacterium]